MYKTRTNVILLVVIAALVAFLVTSAALAAGGKDEISGVSTYSAGETLRFASPWSARFECVAIKGTACPERCGGLARGTRSKCGERAGNPSKSGSTGYP